MFLTVCPNIAELYHIGVTVTEKRPPEKKLIYVSVCVSNELRTLCRCCRVVRLTLTVQKRSPFSSPVRLQNVTWVLVKISRTSCTGERRGKCIRPKKNTVFKCLEPLCFGYVTVFIPISGARHTVHDTCLRDDVRVCSTDHLCRPLLCRRRFTERDVTPNIKPFTIRTLSLHPSRGSSKEEMFCLRWSSKSHGFGATVFSVFRQTEFGGNRCRAIVIRYFSRDSF